MDLTCKTCDGEGGWIEYTELGYSQRITCGLCNGTGRRSCGHRHCKNGLYDGQRAWPCPACRPEEARVAAEKYLAQISELSKQLLEDRP